MRINNQSSLSLLATDVFVLSIHDLYPRLAHLRRVDNRLHQFRLQMLGFSIDLPKLLLHELYLDFVFSWIVEEVITELDTYDEAHEA